MSGGRWRHAEDCFMAASTADMPERCSCGLPSADTQAALRAGGDIARIDGEWVGLWRHFRPVGGEPAYGTRTLPAPSPEETP